MLHCKITFYSILFFNILFYFIDYHDNYFFLLLILNFINIYHHRNKIMIDY